MYLNPVFCLNGNVYTVGGVGGWGVIPDSFQYVRTIEAQSSMEFSVTHRCEADMTQVFLMMGLLKVHTTSCGFVTSQCCRKSTGLNMQSGMSRQQNAVTINVRSQ